MEPPVGPSSKLGGKRKLINESISVGNENREKEENKVSPEKKKQALDPINSGNSFGVLDEEFPVLSQQVVKKDEHKEDRKKNGENQKRNENQEKIKLMIEEAIKKERAQIESKFEKQIDELKSVMRVQAEELVKKDREMEVLREENQGLRRNLEGYEKKEKIVNELVGEMKNNKENKKEDEENRRWNLVSGKHSVKKPEEAQVGLKERKISDIPKCFQYAATGRCDFGNRCKFLKFHTKENISKNNAVCFAFRNKGSCAFGDNCKYLHDRGEKIVFPKICNKFLLGTCQTTPCVRGFAHILIRKVESQCRDFANGGCLFGPRCRFLHVFQGDREGNIVMVQDRNESKR